MPKAVPTSPVAKLVLAESLAAQLDQIVARMNTPADRAARAVFFSASPADLGRAAMNPSAGPQVKSLMSDPTKEPIFQNEVIAEMVVDQLETR